MHVGQAVPVRPAEAFQRLRVDLAVDPQPGQAAVGEHVEPDVSDRRLDRGPKKCRVSDCSRVFGTSSTQAAESSRSAVLESIPRTDAQPAELPMKYDVSISIRRTEPRAASRIVTWSLPLSRRRAFSQPSPMLCARSGRRMFSGDE